MNGYLVCGHCSCEFLATQKQIKNHRFNMKHNPKASSYCSNICRKAGISSKLKKEIPEHGPCPTCGNMFRSRTSKIFCSMDCYSKSDQLQTMLKTNSEKGIAVRQIKLTGKVIPNIKMNCINCGVEFFVKPSLAKNRFYCGKICYRAYMAKRFDRWIANPQTIALPQAYDEFLLQEELPCLIEGCHWKGKHLGNHLNFAHGITAEEFKRAAGFNQTTGLVCPSTSEILSERPHLRLNDGSFGGNRGTGRQILNYISLEGREHRAKARLLSYVTKEYPKHICKECGKEFRQSSPFGYTKYCTIECRDKFYRRKKKHSPPAERVCVGCGKMFMPSPYGIHKYCCVSCRNEAYRNHL